MDAFYASVEQRDRPELRNKPVAVGGTGARGVVAAASYEARAYGVRSAMPTRRALDLCPILLLVAPRFDVYKLVSDQIRKIFLAVTPQVEPLSLDEAYLEVTDQTRDWTTAIGIAKSVKSRILAETQLTASAGVSMNKFLAKMASDQQKPDGLTFISPDDAPAFIAALPVEEFYGVGQATAARMRLQGLTTGADLQKLTEYEMIRRFGKHGRYFYRVARGIDDRPVTPQRERKSVSVERTYSRDLLTDEEIRSALGVLATLLMERISRIDQHGRTITLKVRFDDFTTLTRQRTRDHAITDVPEILGMSEELLQQFDRPLRPIRLLGMGVSGFDPPQRGTQLTLPLDSSS